MTFRLSDAAPWDGLLSGNSRYLFTDISSGDGTASRSSLSNTYLSRLRSKETENTRLSPPLRFGQKNRRGSLDIFATVGELNLDSETVRSYLTRLTGYHFGRRLFLSHDHTPDQLLETKVTHSIVRSVPAA